MQIRKSLLLFIDDIDEMWHVIQNVYAVKPHRSHTQYKPLSLPFYNGENTKANRNSMIELHFQMNILHLCHV